MGLLQPLEPAKLGGTPASLDGALIWNTEAEPQERRATMKRKRAVVPGVGEAKGQGSGGLGKELGLGHRGQADEDQAARDLYLRERRNLLRENFHPVGAVLTASVSCSHP